MEQVSIALFKDKPCDATKVKVNWTEPKLLDRMANITLYQISDNMGKLLQNIQNQSADPWESSQKNHTVTVSEKVSPETQFSWQVSICKFVDNITPYHTDQALENIVG